MSQSEMGFRTAPLGFRREDVLDFIEHESQRRMELQDEIKYLEMEKEQADHHKREAEQTAQALLADRDRILEEQHTKEQAIEVLQNKLRVAQECVTEQESELAALQEKIKALQKELDEAHANEAMLESKCAEYDEARARLAEIELSAHARAEEVMNRAQQDAYALVTEAEQMAERLLSAIERTKESYHMAQVAVERENERARTQVAQTIEQFDEVMSTLRGRISHEDQVPVEVLEQEPQQEPQEQSMPEATQQEVQDTGEQRVEDKPSTPTKDRPTLAQVLGALRSGK